MLTSAVGLLRAAGLRGGILNVQVVQGGLVVEDHFSFNSKLTFVNAVDPTANRVLANGDPDWDSGTFLGSDGDRIFYTQIDTENGDPQPPQVSRVSTPDSVFEMRELIPSSQDVSFAERLGQQSVFRATTESFGTELWSLDYEADTRSVIDLSGGTSSTRFLGEFAEFQDNLYFAASVLDGPRTFYRTDGTLAGTEPIGELPDNTSSTEFVAFQDQLLAIVTTEQNVVSLWGGLGGTDLVPLVESAKSIGVMTASDRAFIEIGRESVAELWVTDGTVSGTSSLLETAPNELFITGRHAWFERDAMLYRTDGTIEGTVVASTDPVKVVGHTDRTLFVISNDELVALRSDIQAQTIDLPFDADQMTAVISTADSFYFVTRENTEVTSDDRSPHETYFRFWRSDGTADGTGLVADWLSPVFVDSQERAWLDNAWQTAGQIVFKATYESWNRAPDFEILASFSDHDELTAHAGGELLYDQHELEYEPSSNFRYEYTLTPGESLTLDASGSFAPGGDARYDWDLNGDGEFDDAAGVQVDVSWEQIRELSAGHPFDAHLRVTTNLGKAFDQVHVRSPDRLVGDANQDGVVDFVDFLALSANYSRQDAIWSMGDFDASGRVGFDDFLLLSENFGRRIA